MKLAVFSDVHGNIFALEAALKEAERFKVDRYLILGDNVGYYYYADKVYKKFESLDCEHVNGNHEKILQEIRAGNINQDMIIEKYGSGHKFALENLDQRAWGIINKNSYHKSISIDGVNILMAHASPWDCETYIYPDSALDVFSKCNLPEFDFIFLGHTHYPNIFKSGETMVVNPGSIGQSRQHGGIANWCLFNSQTKSVQPMSTPYETGLLIKDVCKYDPSNKYMLSILKRGTNE